MSERRKERISILLLSLRSDCCDFVTILERDSVFSTLCPIKWKRRSLIKYRFKTSLRTPTPNSVFSAMPIQLVSLSLEANRNLCLQTGLRILK